MGNHNTDRPDVESLRREYTRDGISEDSVLNNPIDQFALWFEDALVTGQTDANAMTLSTATPDGKPSSRIVLVKGFDKQGFRFYTNYSSRKGWDLEVNPHAALCFYWPALERQVRIEGTVTKLDREESASYFKSRPRDSKIGAWASEQSSEIAGREKLEERFQTLRDKFEGMEIPLPEKWGGYLLRPAHIEFWQGRAGRLHDRILYTRQDEEGWRISRLSP